MGNNVDVKGSRSRPCRFFCKKAVPVRKIINKLKEIRFDLKGGTTVQIEGSPVIKIKYDKLTGSIIKRIRGLSETSIIKGLINFETGDMHLGEVNEEMYFAKQKGLLKSGRFLKEGWDCFTMDCSYLKMRILLVSPSGDVFGGIPVRYSRGFENVIRGLFGDKIEDISFLRMYYRGTETQVRTWDIEDSPGRKYLTSR